MNFDIEILRVGCTIMLVPGYYWKLKDLHVYKLSCDDKIVPGRCWR